MDAKKFYCVGCVIGSTTSYEGQHDQGNVNEPLQAHIGGVQKVFEPLSMEVEVEGQGVERHNEPKQMEGQGVREGVHH